MLYLLKKDSAKSFETRRGVAYNAKICNQDGIVIGDVENQGSGGCTDILIEKEFRDQWRVDLEAKGYEPHHEENLAEWMFDVEDGLIKPYPTEIPSFKELMVWEDVKYSHDAIMKQIEEEDDIQVKTDPWKEAFKNESDELKEFCSEHSIIKENTGGYIFCYNFDVGVDGLYWRITDRDFDLPTNTEGDVVAYLDLALHEPDNYDDLASFFSLLKLVNFDFIDNQICEVNAKSIGELINSLTYINSILKDKFNKKIFKFHVDWETSLVEVEAGSYEEAKELAYKEVMDNLDKYTAPGFQLDANGFD